MARLLVGGKDVDNCGGCLLIFTRSVPHITPCCCCCRFNVELSPMASAAFSAGELPSGGSQAGC